MRPSLGTSPVATTVPPTPGLVSFVLPCLNEAGTVRFCIEQARSAAVHGGFPCEIIVADNGSTDDSDRIAASAGARVVRVEGRGYGRALLAGFKASRGEIIVMGDADGSYDFADAVHLVALVRKGADLAVGDRLGGQIENGAMPWKHRHIGTPVLSGLGRLFFGHRVRDVNCGLRAFSRDAFDRMGLRSDGMELASEMIAKAAVRGLTIREAAISYRRDQRERTPHLRPWRDGWRHTRLMLLLCPVWTLALPGAIPFALGSAVLMLLLPGPLKAGGITLDVHTMVVASLAVTTGYQTLLLSVAMRAYVLTAELGPAPQSVAFAARGITLERGLLFGLALLVTGLGVIAWITLRWAGTGFGELNAPRTLRPTIAGATVAAMGVQTMLTAFICGMLRPSVPSTDA